MTTLKDPPRNILVPVDFGESSEKAAKAACMLAHKVGATVHPLHAYSIAVEPFGAVDTSSQLYLEQFVKECKQRLKDFFALSCPNVTLAQPLVENGDPAHVITEKAKELNVELIVLGTHGRRGLSRALIGSVAEEVARHAHCSVLVVR